MMHKKVHLKILNPPKSEKKKLLTIHTKPNLNKTPKTESTINSFGKSTFINAFAIYLLFENIDRARSDELIVMIPVSFLITINDQFQECLYALTTHNEKILEIIDTPGFGDTHGQDQDEKDLNEMSSYIQNVTHLNAFF